MDTKNCPLCNRNKKLIRSHIIPEGFYRTIYGENKNAIFSSASREMVKKIQVGHREYLLCKECDNNTIGRYDKYAIDVIRDKKYIEEKDNNDSVIWENLDYNEFKLFHLSVLWRAHLAKKLFTGVNLSEKRFNEISQYLKAGKISDEDCYHIFGLYLLDLENDYENCNELITEGKKYNMSILPNSEVYIFIFGGIAWHYIISNSEEANALEKFYLNKSGKIILLKQNIRTFKPFLDISNSVKIANNYSKNNK